MRGNALNKAAFGTPDRGGVLAFGPRPRRYRRAPVRFQSVTSALYAQLLLGRLPEARRTLELRGDEFASEAARRGMQALATCEAERIAVFAGERSPVALGAARAWSLIQVDVFSLTARRQYRQAARLRREAAPLCPVLTGIADGRAFRHFYDADSRLGMMFELYVDGTYRWLPMDEVAWIRIAPPTGLLHLICLPVEIGLRDGNVFAAAMPARYPLASLDSPPAIVLGCETRWFEEVGASYFGRGQRTWHTVDATYPIAGTGHIAFDSQPATCRAPAT